MQSSKCGAHSGSPQGKYAHHHETNIHCLEITFIAMTIIFIAKMIIIIVMKPILKTWRIYSTINRRKILVTLGRVGRTQQWRKPALFISRCLRRAAWKGKTKTNQFPPKYTKKPSQKAPPPQIFLRNSEHPFCNDESPIGNVATLFLLLGERAHCDLSEIDPMSMKKQLFNQLCSCVLSFASPHPTPHSPVPVQLMTVLWNYSSCVMPAELRLQEE